jgi:gliding motility-associated-like protein
MGKSSTNYKSHSIAEIAFFVIIAFLATGSVSVCAQSVTFNYTGSPQYYTVPANVNCLQIDARGAKGGGANGGNGARVVANISVTPGQVLEINVGGSGTCGANSNGWNGGGTGKAANNATNASCGGGGASDVRVVAYSLATRIIVAAGGGGMGGGTEDAIGGAGGCATGLAGNSPFGQGGGGATQFSGGAGGPPWIASGNPGTAGSLGLGGNGGTDPCYNNSPGGGGGGGLYGGGGGGSDCFSSAPYGGGSGGGGSSLTPAGGTCTANFNNGNGLVIITPPAPTTFSLGSNAPICSGQTLNLTLSNIVGSPGPYTYAWSGPNGFSSNQQNPSIPNVQNSAAGTYTAYLIANGCTLGVNTINVVINNGANPPVLGSNSPICEGQNLNLTASNIAGANYFWTGPNGFNSNQQNPTINAATAAANGNYSAYAVVNGCTTATVTVNVVVSPLPGAPVLGSNSPVCAGEVLNLTSNSVAGATYVWNGPGGFNSNIQNPTINSAVVANSGNYSMYYVIGTCTSATSTISVIVNPSPNPPTPGSNSPVCDGAALNLTASNVAGASYYWTGPGGYSSTTQNPTINPAILTNSGIYSSYAIVNNCTSTANTINVVINPIPTAPVLGSNSPVCEGSTLNLTAAAVAGATYVWSGPNGFTSNLQNPVINNAQASASGNYTGYIVVNGCTSATSTINVTVTAIPTAPVVGSNSPVCAGNSLNLTSDLIAGATYVWSGPGGFNSNLQNPSVNPAALANAGIYTASVVVGTCTSAVSTVNVVVNPTPNAPNLGSNSPVCEGFALNLTSNATAGATYNWTGPNAYTSNSQNPTINSVTAAASGTYSMNIIVNGCTSATSTLNVVVNPIPSAPVINTNTPLCEGSTLNLTANAVAGATFNWIGPAGFNSNLQNPTINNVGVNASGNYNAYVVVNGCTSNISTIAVNVVNLPSAPVLANNGPICQGQTLNLTANGLAGATYMWSGPNGYSSNNQNNTINNAATNLSGVYSAYIVAGGCTSATSNTNVVVNPTPSAPVINSNSPICAGSALNLTSNATAGATYSWTGPNGFTSNQQNPIINNATVNASGVYNAYITVNGCSSATATLTATVNPIPTAPVIASNSPVCAGSNLTLTSNLTAGATYVWSGPNGFVSNMQNPVITNATSAATGNYNSYIVVSGCTSATSNLNATVYPIPSAPVLGSNSPICAGSNLNLTSNATAGATYVWTGPNGFTSNLQNPVINAATTAASGNYSGYIIVNGCTSATTNINVVVNPIPNAPVLGSNSPVCDGFALNLTSNLTANATYVWTGPSGFSSNNQNPVINPASVANSGNYNAYIVVSGCTSATTTLNAIITPIPGTPVLGSNSPVCAGFQLDLTSTGPAGANYVWTGPNGFTSNQQNPVIASPTVAASGNYSAYIVVSGCTSATSNVNVVVNPIPSAPVIGSNSPVCDGFSLDLTANNIAGATYVWSGPNGFSSNQQNPSINPVPLAAAGSYSAYVVVNACTSATSNVSTIVHPIPAAPLTASNSPVCETFSLNLTSNQTAGATYVWSGPNAFFSNQQNPVINPVSLAASGAYDTYIVVNNCTSATSTINVMINPIPAAPVIASNSPVCEGSALSFTSNAVAGATYVWTGPNGFNSNTQNPSINNSTLAATGNYSAYIVVSGCTSSTSNTNAVVNFIPTSDFTLTPSLCENANASVVYTGTGTGNATYNWSFNGGNVVSGSNAGPYQVNWSNFGNYNVTLTVTENNCVSTQTLQPITVYQIPSSTFSLNQSVCTAQDALITYTGTATPNATYNWNFSNGNITSGSGQGPYNVNWTNPATYNVSLTVTENGCVSTQTVNPIIVYPIPTSTFNANAQLCAGLNLPVNYTGTATGAAFYNWNFNGAVVNAGQNQGPYQITWNNPGTYTISLQVTENGCISPQTDFNVTVYQVPTSSFIIPAAACEGDDITITYNGNATQNATYAWTHAGGQLVSGSGQGPLTVNYSAANTYPITLIVTEDGCVSTNTQQNIIIHPTPIALAGVDVNICSGTPANIGANALPGYTYQWTPAAGLSDPNISNPAITLTNNIPGNLVQTYTLTVTSNGCSNTDDVEVTIRPNPSAILNLPQPQCLSGNNFNFAAAGNFGAGATFFWTFANATPPTSNDQNPSALQFNAAGQHPVTLMISENGCNSPVETGFVTVYEMPLPAFGATPTEGCEPLLVTFTNGTFSNVAYNSSWNFGDGTTSLQTSPTHTFTNGIYSVTLQVQDINGCQATLQLPNLIQSNPNPIAGFTPNPYVTTLDEPTISFFDGSSFANSWTYSFGDGSSANIQSPDHTYNSEGEYVVVQVVSNQFGCVDSVSNLVVVEPVSIVYIPNTFTPNGDGLNDIWQPMMTYVKDYTLRVFDRWGNVIFITDDIYEGWNGKFGNDGADVKEDAYVYLITYNTYQNKAKELRGNINVVR